jgi:hypothetical protein
MKYAMTLETLKNMDEKQLLEMFHDMDNEDAVERIMDCAKHFLYGKCGRCNNEKTQDEDAKEIDDARRLRDIK